MEKKRIKVLVIDDNQDNLTSLKALVKLVLPEVLTLTANRGEDGLVLASSEDPDVILLDILMPGMDGFEVCAKLKASESTRDIPVVFVTALREDSRNRIFALEAGAEGFLTKPVDETELMAQIRCMLKIRESNRHRKNEKYRLAGLVSEKTRELRKKHRETLNLLKELKKEHDSSVEKEESLRESHLQLQTVISASQTGLWDWNIKTGKVYFSPEYKRQIGYEEHEISNVFSEWESRVHPDDLETAFSKVSNFINNPWPDFENEFRFRHKKGHYIWILAKASLIKDEDGKPLRMLGSHLDITARKQLHEELEQKINELERFNRLMVGREERMMELKAEVNRLLEKEGKPRKYRIIKEIPDEK